MTVSIFELFKIGVGPSSSHTMGPMVAAKRFTDGLFASGAAARVGQIEVGLYSSLALTGKGHATDTAIMLGLAGLLPETLNMEVARATVARVREQKRLLLGGRLDIDFDESADILWRGFERRERHPNALRIMAYSDAGDVLDSNEYYSIGGGSVVAANDQAAAALVDDSLPPFAFRTAAELLDMANSRGLTIAELMLLNEEARLDRGEIERKIDALLRVMDDCIDRGLSAEGVLPGALSVRRRAAGIYRQIVGRHSGFGQSDPLAAMDWVNVWAMAVNEENAAGGQVVTAPTNGAAGVIPAVLRFHRDLLGGTKAERRTFLLTAGAIGALYKRNASISGAEVGCQGEVGVACSMAAAGLAAVMGANNAQIENAAEIGMEHNLGLTCDPIGGLVQIPCIERNAMGAIKAIDAARLALLGDGNHSVSLDKVIATMARTGADMNHIYKETSLGGLAAEFQAAVNLAEC